MALTSYQLSKQRIATDVWDKTEFHSEMQTPEIDLGQAGNHKCPHSSRIPFLKSLKTHKNH